MRTLLDIIERYSGSLHYYKTEGLRGINSFYEINSHKAYLLNNFSGGEYILNEKGQVQCFGGRGEQPDDAILEEDRIPYGDYLKWWGKTLDQYYLHPYFPDKEIKRIEIIKTLPFAKIKDTFKVIDGEVKIGPFTYTIINCYEYPEFFKPLYV